MMSSIFYLVTKDSFSEFHSVSSDEIYHFYMGDPVELMEISPEGDFNSTTLGQNLTIGQSLQHTVRRGSWQSLHVKEGGEYALLGCTVGPGFVLEDFHKLSWEALLRLFPKHHMAIMKYTRK